MEINGIIRKTASFVFLAILGLVPVGVKAADRTIDCDVGDTIQEVLSRLRPGDTLLVVGTCNENVVIGEQHHDITLECPGTATINGPSATSPTITIRGRNITIKNFAGAGGITGGSNGILVTRGGTARIEGNIIENTGSRGISVTQHSFARIIDNTIQNNTSDGVAVSDTSSARIGFLSGSDTVARPNTITGNGSRGIRVRRGSYARIVGNDISNNSNDGVDVRSGSYAHISDNDIDGNGDDGIEVGRLSGVQLGSDAGAGIFDAPNRTAGGDLNGDDGLRGFQQCVVDGRIGTLAGAINVKDVAGSCSDTLI